MGAAELWIVLLFVPFILFTILVIVSMLLGSDKPIPIDVRNGPAFERMASADTSWHDYDEDVRQMLAVQNAGRRPGTEVRLPSMLPHVNVDAFTRMPAMKTRRQALQDLAQRDAVAGVMDGVAPADPEQREALEDVELQELTDMTNLDRRRRGLPELSRAEVARRMFEHSWDGAGASRPR